MDNQQSTDMFWDIDCSGVVLTEEDLEKMAQDASEFIAMNSQDIQPMDTTDYSYLDEPYQAPAQSGDFAGSYQPAELPINNKELTYPQLNSQDFFADNFSDFIVGNSFSVDQVTDSMAEGLDNITIEPTYQQNKITNDLIDPTLLSGEPNENFLPSYGLSPTETFEDHNLHDLANFESLQQDFEFDDSGLFGDDEPVSAAAAPKSQLFLPTFSRSAAKKPRHRPVIEKEIISESPQGEATLRAQYTATGPKTPTWPVFRSLVNVSPLACAGEIKIVNNYKAQNGDKMKKAHKYTVYKPLRPWSKIRYNSRGYLHENIKFNPTTMAEFIEKHPLGNNLVLRIEKHPYDIKARETGKAQYTSCRAKRCLHSGEGRFLVGDLRVAIDEVTGRFAPGQIQNNCPYFAAGFIHLECLESLINVAPLANAGILVPDTRRMLPHEPESTRRQGGPGNNKMILPRKQINQFEKWKEEHQADSERASAENTLNAILWISGQRQGRIKSRFPPGVTEKMVTKFLKENRTTNGWGGRRMANGTIDELNAAIAAGRAHEIVAPRNGPTGKKGMNIDGCKPQKRCRDETSSSEDFDSEPDSSLPQQKRRRISPGDNTNAASTIKQEPQHRHRRYRPADPSSSPAPGLTYYDNLSVVPHNGEVVDDNSLCEITKEEAMKTWRHASPKKAIESYVISDDDDTNKENSDPFGIREASLD